MFMMTDTEEDAAGGEIGQHRLVFKNKDFVLNRNPTSTILLITNLRVKKSYFFLIWGKVVCGDIYHSMCMVVMMTSKNKFCPSIMWVLRLQLTSLDLAASTITHCAISLAQKGS